MNGEPEDDGPDHTKSHLDVAIDDFCKKKNFVKLIDEKLVCRLLISNSSKTFSMEKTVEETNLPLFFSFLKPQKSICGLWPIKEFFLFS